MTDVDESGIDETWFDEEAGPLVRPYAVTRGRTRTSSHDLQLITLVVAVRPPAFVAQSGLDPEHLQILSLCKAPTSIAELSAILGLPLSVVKILIGDLVDKGLVVHRSAAIPDLNVLHAVINGIRRL